MSVAKLVWIIHILHYFNITVAPSFTYKCFHSIVAFNTEEEPMSSWVSLDPWWRGSVGHL